MDGATPHQRVIVSIGVVFGGCGGGGLDDNGDFDVAALAATMMTSLLALFGRCLSASLRGSGRRSWASQSAPDDELGTDIAGGGAAVPGAAGGGMCAPSASGSGHSWMPNG